MLEKKKEVLTAQPSKQQGVSKLTPEITVIEERKTSAHVILEGAVAIDSESSKPITMRNSFDALQLLEFI